MEQKVYKIRTKAITFLSICILLSSIIISGAIVYTHRYKVISERAVLDTWKNTAVLLGQKERFKVN